MSKKFLGNIQLPNVMDKILDIFPSKEITDVQTMWDNVGKPVIGDDVAPIGSLDNWNYTLDDSNNTVTLNYYTGSETDVIVYGKYQSDGKVYDTIIASNPNSSTSSTYMFNGKASTNCKNIQTITFNDGINTSACINMFAMFYNCAALTQINGLENFDTSNVENMSWMFYGCNALTSLDLSSFDTSSVTSMNSMFYNCKALAAINGLENFDTFEVINMNNMFSNCAALTSLDLSSFDTSSVTSMNSMFNGCTNLSQINGLGNFDTSGLTSMQSVFQGCAALTSLDLSSFDTSSVTSMNALFNGCSSLTEIDLRSFDTSAVTDMMFMFQNCSSVQEIKATTGKWVIQGGCNTTIMFSGCGVSSVTEYPAA